MVPVRAPARLRRERRSVRSPFSGESNAALVAPYSSWSDETWLPEWSGKLGGVQRCAVRSRGSSWGKPVFRLTERKIEFPGSLAWGTGCKFSATERAHKRNAGQIDAEWRQPSLVTTPGEKQNHVFGVK